KWISQADAKRLLPNDYLYRGRDEIALKEDSLGIKDLRKALTLDTNQVDIYGEIAKSLYSLNKFQEAGDAYHVYAQKSKQAKLTDHFYEGLSYYLAYSDQLTKADKDKTFKPDSTLLIKADSAFTYVERKETNPNVTVALYHAYVKDYEDSDRNNIKGLAKPFYEQYIQLALAKGTPDDKTKQKL